MTQSQEVPRSHPVRQYVERVASLDHEEYPTWDLSAPLPKLPVPPLSQTLENYLRCVEPTLTPEQYERAKRLVEEFGAAGGTGEYLQHKLREYADTKDNWVYHFWLDDMYLKARLPLPVNSNVSMVFPRQNFQDQDQQLRFAARLISGILDYKVIIDSRSLPVDRARTREKGQPLCMAQYYRLFCSYRVPGVATDALVAPPSVIMPEPEHIIVICKNQFFVLDVLLNFTRLSDDNLYTQLKRIVRMAEDGEEDAEGVGIFTSADRDRWARNRMKLMQDAVNRDSLDMIERCIFCLCLDDDIPLSFNHQNSVDETQMRMRDDVSLALQMLHGFGSKVNSCNRWFDKTMQFIVAEDGACGLNYEHSPSEGIAVVQLIEHLLKYMEEVRKRKLPRMQSICELPHPHKLRWHLTKELQRERERAAFALDRMIDTLDLYVLRFEQYGKNFPKSQNTSPDAFIQLAIQLTYYKIHGRMVSTYESASIRRFRLGRVDNIRACTTEALEWCKAMIGEVEATDVEKMDLFRRAVKRQTEILKETILGHGIDNHLLGLKKIAEELGMPKPALFEDEAYQISNHFTLSTSQVPTTMDAFMCYGAVVPDGYGVCYNPHESYILVGISSFNTCGETRSDFFAFTMESSFMQMKELCIKASLPPIEDTGRSTPKLRHRSSRGSLSNGLADNNNQVKPASPKKRHLMRQRQSSRSRENSVDKCNGIAK